MLGKTPLQWIAIALLVAFPGAIQAQDTGTVSGVVRDVAGEPIPGAKVSIQGTSLFAFADREGAYEIAGVPAGAQTVVATLEGFRQEEQSAEVEAGGASTADFTLALDLLSMDTIVVTGGVSPYEKLESSTAVTTQTATEISEKAPLSTAQMLEVVPGFWSESSGGEGGNNLFARGIPQDGSFRYVAMYEDGLPVFDSPELAFTNIDLLFRIDESVASMEAVRGGTASVFASNAPGGIINFVNKTGGESLEGEVKFTGGDYDLFRTDFSYGGPLTESWRFHVGGFYREDSGVRDPGFPANRGGQVKASLTRELDNGYVRLNAKRLDERNIFYLPIPLQNPDDPRGIPGFDPNTGTLTSLDAAQVKIPTPDGTLDRNLKDGMNPEISQVGGEVFLDLPNGWTFKDSFRYMEADVLFNAIFSLFDPFDANQYGLDQVARFSGATDFRYTYAHSPDLTFDPNSANGNGLVIESGWWTVKKPLDMFVNDARFTRKIGDHSLTFGYYFSRFGAEETWSFNNILTEVRDAPRLLNLEILDANGDVITRTDNGFTRYGSFHRNATGDATVNALYVSDEIQATDRLRVDIGLRWEDAEFSGNIEQLETFDLGDGETFADDQVTWGNGNFLPYEDSRDELAYSVGANFSVTDNLAFYGRWSEGFRMPDFDDLNTTFGDFDTEENTQIEGGVKYSSPRVGLFAAIYQSTFDNVPFQDEVIDPITGNLVTDLRFASTETIGIEAEVVAQIARGLTVAVTATLQQPEFDSFVRQAFNPDTGRVETFDFSGNQLRRIPEEIFAVKPAYERGPLRVFGSWFYAGERFVDEANNLPLPAYQVIDVGASYELTPQLQLELHGNNVTDEIGLTEGNPRTGQVIGVQRDVFMARPILGQSWRLGVTYRF